MMDLGLGIWESMMEGGAQGFHGGARRTSLLDLLRAAPPRPCSDLAAGQSPPATACSRAAVTFTQTSMPPEQTTSSTSSSSSIRLPPPPGVNSSMDYSPRYLTYDGKESLPCSSLFEEIDLGLSVLLAYEDTEEDFLDDHEGYFLNLSVNNVHKDQYEQLKLERIVYLDYATCHSTPGFRWRSICNSY